ncbi:unnamed protein product [Peronospora belbahrii]|uniref:Retroviral polymerase SH3-like domain-containing protein n=1 Tax=Peronospora belbahrii TaxID=622444 RepID=A0ABN8D4X6_9STRA|nr:unnamed protein product [Peronospora belbahrii]
MTSKEKRLKWDLKARAGIFSSYEEVSKAYRVFDIEEGRVVVSRDVNFDESSFGLSPPVEDDVVDDLDFDSLGLDDEGLRQMEYQQTVKRTNCSSDEDAADRPPRTVRQRPGLDISSEPKNDSPRQEEEDDEGNRTNRLRLCFACECKCC